MAKRRVLVQRHFGVQGVDRAVGSQDQRVDLRQVAVASRITVVQFHEQFGDLFARDFVEIGLVDPATRRLEVESAHRVN